MYATTTGECRCDLANRREQPNGDQSEFHDQPLGTRSTCPTADDFYAAARREITEAIDVGQPVPMRERNDDIAFVANQRAWDRNEATIRLGRRLEG